ncbi:MAG: hypothetical protein AAF805_10490 [Planctomycetota bacterium]
MPAHLLRPWAAVSPVDSFRDAVPASDPIDVVANEVAASDEAETQPEANADDSPVEPTQKPTQEPVTDPGDEWTAALTGDAVAAPAPLTESISFDAATAWEAECAAEPTDHTATPVEAATEDSDARQPPIAESPTAEPVSIEQESVEQPSVEPPSASPNESAPSDIGTPLAGSPAVEPLLRGRIAAGRQRVRRLAASLREERRASAEWRTQSAQQAELLDAAEQGLHAVEQLLADAQEKLAEAESRADTAESGLASAIASADEAVRRADALEAEVTELGAALRDAELAAGEPVAAQRAPAELSAATAAPDEAPQTVDGGAFGEAAAAVEPAPDAQPGAEAWGDPAGAETPEAVTAAATTDDALTLSDPSEAIDAPAHDAAGEPDGDLWAIEQLPSEPTDAAGATADVVTADEIARQLGEETDPGAVSEGIDALSDLPRDPELPPELQAEAEHAPTMSAAFPDPDAVVESTDEIAGEAAQHDFSEDHPHEPADPFAAPAEESNADPFEPESFIDRYASSLPDEDAPVEPPQPVEPIAALAEPEPVAGDDDEESIDDYMKKLLGRMRGDDEPAAPVSVAPVAAPEPASQRSPESVAAAELPEPEPEPVVPIRDLAELRRGPAPEVTTDLGALRQLANQSARQAIDVAATKSNREQATTGLAVAVIGVVSGALAAMTAGSVFGVQFLGGLGAVVACGAVGVRTLRGCQTPAAELAKPLVPANLSPSEG